jgi:hypothetical protein
MLTIRAKFPSNHIYSNLTADFVLARSETYSDPITGQPVVYSGTLEDDLRRRDFTINAMAIDVINPSVLIDMFCGNKDLTSRLIRTTIDPLLSMLEDPSRLLRALRFKIKYGFVIDGNLWLAMTNQTVINKLFEVVSSDHIREELTKMFKISTINTLFLLRKLDENCEYGCNFTDRLFKNGLWLKPTNEKI